MPNCPYDDQPLHLRKITIHVANPANEYGDGEMIIWQEECSLCDYTMDTEAPEDFALAERI